MISKDFGGNNIVLSNDAAERAILGCLIKLPGLMVECSSKINPEDFTNDHNKYLYKIMLHIFTKQNGKKDYVFDLASLHILAKEKGAEEIFFEKSGGRDYIEFLNIIKESFVDISKFENYIETVHNLAVKRKLVQNLEAFEQKILNTDADPEELMIQEQNSLNEILVTMGNHSNELINLGSMSKMFLESALKTKKEIIGLKCGFPKLDLALEGIQRSRLYVVAAPRKTGKTAFLLNFGINVGIKNRVPTLMISTEMNDEQIMSRVLANISQINERSILKGSVSEKEKERLMISQERFDKGQFYHVYMPGFTLEKVISSVRKFVNNVVGFDSNGRPKDCLVLFDYIKLPQTGISNKDQKEYKVLGSICDGLKMLAGNLDIPIVTACQTNRSGDTANSYEITWFCDTYLELTKRPEKEIMRNSEMGMNRGNQTVKIKASRNGEESDNDGIGFDYDGNTLTYTEVGFAGNK